MRKILSALLLVLPLTVATAQSSLPDPFDTVTELPSNYFSPSWYTGCSSFRADTVSFVVHKVLQKGFFGTAPSMAKEFYTPGPREVSGMAALVLIDTSRYLSSTGELLSLSDHVPEYLTLLQGTTRSVIDTSFSLDPVPYPCNVVVLDSLRWDTASPRLLRLPMFPSAVADSDYFQCYLYEVFFDNPVTVDSVFYVMGSCNSNILSNNGYTFDHHPVVYFSLLEHIGNRCFRCREHNFLGIYACHTFPSPPETWVVRNSATPMFGFFFPIIVEPGVPEE